MKTIFALTILICLFAIPTSSAQETEPDFAADKGSFMISGSAGFSSFGGDAYGGEDRVTVIRLQPGLSYFIIPNVAIGGQVEYEKTSFGDDDETFYGAGPILAYYFGEKDSRFLPFANLSFLWGKQTDRFSQTVVRFGAGSVYLLIPQVGVSAQIFYQFENLSPENAGQSTSGNAYGISMGVAAFVF